MASEIIKSALKTAQEQCPGRTFDQKTVQDIQKKAESTVNELSLTLHKIRKEGKTGDDVVSHLTPERVKKIKAALDIKTFQIYIDKEEKKAQIIRNGNKDMYPALNLDSVRSLNEAEALQMASIIIEAIILVLEIIGINVPNDDKLVKIAIDIVIKDLQKSNTLIQDIKQIKKDKDNFAAMAKDILVLVMDCIGEGIFWPIVRALLTNMSWFDWAVTCAMIAAFIALSVSTDGLADIILIAVKLANAAFFINKLINLETLSTM